MFHGHGVAIVVIVVLAGALYFAYKRGYFSFLKRSGT